MPLVLGTRLGPYEIVAPLGSGGMGEVYRARDTRLDRTVAIKVLPAEVATDSDARIRFEREARAVAALDHPHICGIYDVGMADGTHYLVMPYLDGQTLATRLEQGAISVDQAVKIGAEIADALDRAHRQGITHRDVKPANVMLTKTGSKLLDFGLAKLRGPVAPISLSGLSQLVTQSPNTAQGTLLGTVPYMAPEQVEGKEADTRSDIWAVGALIHEMVTGTRPFPGDTPASVISAILRDEPSPISRAQPLAPALLDRVVTRCLAKDPENRWQSARDLRTALSWIGDTTQVTSRQSVSRARWVATLVALLASAGALGWFGASVWAPIGSPRALSLQIGPPAGGKLVLSAQRGGFSISPDGKAVAFVANVAGVSRLWVRPLDTIESRELPDTDDAQYPFWSSDGRSLGYFAHGYLRRIDVLGGASTMLAPLSSLPRGGSWSEDGTIVYCQSAGPLFRINASGGTPSALTTLATTEVSHRWPRFLPDGRTLFFFAQGDRPGVYLTTLDGDREKHRVADNSSDAAYVPPRGGRPAYLLMVRGDSIVAQPFDVASEQLVGAVMAIPGAGNALVFTGTNLSNLSVARDGTIVYATGSNRYQLTWFAGDGTPVRTVGAPDRYAGVRISPDGTEALALVDDTVGSRDLWRIALTRDARARITLDNRGNFGTWSPDGQRIAFSGLARQTLFVKDASGDTPDRVLLESGGPVYPIDWSQDGKQVLYVRGSPGFDLFSVSPDGGGKGTAILQTPASEIQGQFSPDSRWIAFSSDESGRDEVYIQNLLDRKMRWRVSTGGGGYPRWNKAGNELFFREPDGELVAVPVRLDRSPNVGEPRRVMRLIEPPALFPYPYDVASDGRILALAPVSGSEADISLTVLVDWQTKLPQ